jgi:hypothetical protein
MTARAPAETGQLMGGAFVTVEKKRTPRADAMASPAREAILIRSVRYQPQADLGRTSRTAHRATS